jgi:ADP-dependent NAD(P)H-hydrate dehydratase / NAD(P)H-hydrate epimerase
MKIVTAARMREIDQECIRRGTPVKVLMENAGKAVAQETRRLLGDIKKQDIICLTGAGNNGGDGLVAARYLADWGAKVTVYLCSDRPADDENLKLLRDRNIKCIYAKTENQLDKMLASATCVIDGLLGTGKMRPLDGVFQNTLEKVNAAKALYRFMIVAIDLPSGMDADTGAIDPACPDADLTVTLAFPKPGLFSYPGAEKVGKLVVSDIGIPAALADDSKMELMTADWAAKALPFRPGNANKGTFGKALVCAGSTNYIGAAFLACSGALRSGAGLVSLAASKSLITSVAGRMPETTYLPLPEVETGINTREAAKLLKKEYPRYNSLLFGCGMGQSAATIDLLGNLLSNTDLLPLVLDADGLNSLVQIADWEKKIPRNAILTPHPGEMSRLAGKTIDEVQQDRTGSAQALAKKLNCTVVLKGAYTVIAARDGRCRISPYANPGLATAGTGDVLAGVIAGLAAQKLDTFDAAALGVCLHGEAGEIVRAEIGDTGMIASDLLPALPKAINKLKTRL